MCAGGAKGTASANETEKCAGGAKGAAAAQSGHDGDDEVVMVAPLSLRDFMGSAAAAEHGMGKPQMQSAKTEFVQQGAPLRPDGRMLA
eukprot:6110862-Karenia_brevis.AAC.1